MIERLRVWIPAGAAGEFSSPEWTLCADSYSVSVPPCVTEMACQRLRSFCQKWRWQITPENAYTLDLLKPEWADYAAVQAECRNISRNKLTRNSSRNTQSQSSQRTEPLRTDPGLKSGISLRELISTRKKKSAGREWIAIRSPEILSCEQKATTIHHTKFRLSRSNFPSWKKQYNIFLISAFAGC